jgi:hypothetical protein
MGFGVFFEWGNVSGDGDGIGIYDWDDGFGVGHNGQ